MTRSRDGDDRVERRRRGPGPRNDGRPVLHLFDLGAKHERHPAQTEDEDQRARDQSAPQMKSRREAPPVDTAGAPHVRSHLLMGETMRRIAVLLFASLFVVSGATASPRSDNLVSKAVQALG